MFAVNEDKSLYVTRGDIFFFSVQANDNGQTYIFQPGDIVRINVTEKKACENVVLQKDFLVSSATDTVEILLTEKDTKIGETISKARDYWYEVVLNPETNPQTIIGYDDDGAKIFKLFPEGDGYSESEDEELTPEDIPIIDDEIDVFSDRPVRNRAIAREIVRINDEIARVDNDIEDSNQKTNEKISALSGRITSQSSEIAVERARITNLAKLTSGSTTGDAELTDGRVGEDGKTYASIGEAIRKQFGNSFKNALYGITDNSTYTDANELPVNKAFMFSFYGNNVSKVIANLPDGILNGVIFTLLNNGAYVQICISNAGDIYRRLKWGASATWKTWTKLLDTNNISSILQPYFTFGAQYSTDEVISDLNDLTPNRAYIISLYQDETDTIANMPPNERHGYVMTFGDSSNQMQLFISNTNTMYIRHSWGQKTWKAWVQIAKTSDIETIDESVPLAKVRENAGLLECFLNVGCIGDSLASGESISTENGANKYNDIYKHSWGQYLARMTGNKYYNWSSGGHRTGSWLTSSFATECFDGEHKCEAYIIGLGQNDANYGVVVGTSSDIDLNNYNNNKESYYGNYGKIIQKIKEVQPKAKIFILTDPLASTETKGYNAAVRNIADMFDNVYLVDLYTYGQHLFDSEFMKANKRSGHYNAVGYRECALYIASYIDWIMRNNPSEFTQIEFIGTDLEY